MSANPSLNSLHSFGRQQDIPAASGLTLEALLIPAEVAGPMCGRSKASWWRDHAAERIPAPVKLGGRTLWRVEELRRWAAAGCPGRRTWEALEKSCRT